MLRLPPTVILAAAMVQVATWNLAAEPFAPPMAYPADRYESGWMMNPFTLKTAPTAIQKESFAKDLALGGVYGPVDKPIVSFVNTKTRKRTKLSPGETDENGLFLKAVYVKPSRKDTYAEVTMGGDAATIRYDNALIAQLAASGPAAGAPAPGGAGQGPPPAAGHMGGAPNAPGAPPVITRAPQGGNPPVTPGAPGGAPQGGYTPNPYSVSGAPPASTPPAATNGTGNMPTPMRRRLQTVPVAPTNNTGR